MGSSDITNVYAALDRTHTVVALERSRRGDEGFRTFFDEFADYAANKGYIPYLLLLNFHVDDGSRLPPIEAKERGYRLAHLAPLEVKDIRQALMLYDLLYCRKHGLDPLAAQNTARNLCYKDAYAGFRNESIPALSQPGAPYRAVETEGGVALFRRGERGDEAARSFFAFLTAHPDGRGLTCGVETLRIYDVELSEEQYSSEACLPYFDHEQMRFVPRHSGRCDSVLQRGCCLKEYDMRAGAAKLAAAPDSGTEASSEALRRLLTIVTLRHIARNGYEPFCWGGSDFPGYDFPFADRFKNADRESAAAMTDDSRTTAADILRTSIRQGRSRRVRCRAETFAFTGIFSLSTCCSDPRGCWSATNATGTEERCLVTFSNTNAMKMEILEKINFRQTRYMLPAILYIPLPGGPYFIFDLFHTETAEIPDKMLQTTEFLNPELPEAQIGDDGIGSKYENMVKSWGEIRDYSSVDNIERDKPDGNEEEYESQYMQDDIVRFYGTDGMEGLYVPNSQFRETSKDVASGAMSGNMNLSTCGYGSDSLAQWEIQAMPNACQKTSDAISKAIKKNKVKLKYGTFVYLVNSNQKRQQRL